MPDARIAFISLSSDNLPKVIKVDNKTAIGTDKAMIQARFKIGILRLLEHLTLYQENGQSPLKENL